MAIALGKIFRGTLYGNNCPGNNCPGGNCPVPAAIIDLNRLILFSFCKSDQGGSVQF